MIILSKCIDTCNVALNKKPLVRSFNGGIPGCNLPFRKGINNPMRFTAFFLLAGVIGFGAPWFVVMHQMLK